ncbi:MAG: hypothetical protein KF862_26805 [Chitinophagaceae bacterium]|nr:hypothetical protein [Chitinophagaceae bacterium]
MRKNIFLPITAIALLILPGCSRAWDYFEDHPDDPARNCRIEKISFEATNADEEAPAGYALFEYNAEGNPTFIRYNIPFDEYFPRDKRFSYDAGNRLRVYLSDAFISSWHLYTYVSPTKIIDSAFMYSGGNVDVNDHPDTYVDIRVSRLTLDFVGRIIKEETTYGNGSVSEKTFTYNADGNLIRPGVTYTNQPSIRQTNKVWKFIDRDYSVNQPEGEIEVFNTYNLPYIFKEERLQPVNSDIPLNYRNTVVEYGCD